MSEKREGGPGKFVKGVAAASAFLAANSPQVNPAAEQTQAVEKAGVEAAGWTGKTLIEGAEGLAHVVEGQVGQDNKPEVKAAPGPEVKLESSPAKPAIPESEAQLIERLQQPPKMEPRPELLKSPWINRLSERQEQIIERLNLTAEQKQFLREVIFIARRVYAEGYQINMTGMVTQAALEGGWQHAPKYNDWGMKIGNYKGDAQFYSKAAEYSKKFHHDVTVPDWFRAFGSLLEGGRNYGQFIMELYPEAGRAHTIEDFGYIIQNEPYLYQGKIHHRRYASGHTEDGHDYTDQLINIAKNHHLEELTAFPTEEFIP